jgi:integrase
MAAKSVPPISLARRNAKGAKKKKKLPEGVVVKNDRWYVRLRYRSGGKRHAAWRECAKNATDAKDVRAALEEELKEHGPELLQHNRDNFGELATHYKTKYLIPAKYVDGRKTEGRRSHKNARYELETLRSIIPDSTKLREMNYGFVRQVRLDLFNLPVTVMKWVPTERVRPDGKVFIKKRGEKKEFQRQRSTIDVNRKMEILRRMLKIARTHLEWIHHDPFADAKESLITRSDEKKRRRVMSFEEEDALLTFCVEPRPHLRLVIIGLVDSMMRSGEFFKLRVRDLGFDPKSVTVQQMNTKTLTERSAPMSARFARELKIWFETHDLGPDDRVFDFAGARTSWKTAKRLAGVTDLRLRDLRRTGATRLLRGGMPMEEISRILGHTGINMTYEYIGVDNNTTGRAVDIIDAMHERRELGQLQTVLST